MITDTRGAELALGLLLLTEIGSWVRLALLMTLRCSAGVAPRYALSCAEVAVETNCLRRD